ncbi:MAG: acyltransferase family protein [Paludibacteraceae bacterium]|nr:acyltransferase family protein [Paludibacteraceae bacterium]
MPSAQYSNRIVWADWIKVVLISLVIMGHTGSSLIPVIYTFHIPAFFFVSGYLSNYEKPIKHLLKTSLLLAGAIVIWNIIFVACNIPDGVKGADLHKIWLFVRNSLIKTFWCYYPTSKWGHGLLCQMWFVWVLIIIKLACGLIARRGERLKLGVILACVVYTAIVYHNDVRTWFYLDRSICALPFFLAGNMARGMKIDVDKLSSIRNIAIAAAMMTICVVVTLKTYDRSIDMFHFRLGRNAILYYTTAAIGTALCIMICTKLPRAKAIEILSNGTLLILAIHIWLYQYLDEYFIFDKTRITETLAIVLICLPLVYITEKWCPILLGKNKHTKKK